MTSDLQRLIYSIYRFNKLKVKYNSIEEMKEIAEEIHNSYMVEDTSDINIIIGWVKIFRKFHPELDGFLDGLTYFKKYSEDTGANLLIKGKTYDTHNCLLQQQIMWYWSSLTGKLPRALRETIKSKEQVINPNLTNIFSMIENSYIGLNMNFANGLKSIIETEGGIDSGYNADNIKNKKAHGFPFVGDIHYTKILQDNQAIIRLKLGEKFIDGSIRLLNYPQEPGSKKEFNVSYSGLPEINISIEGVENVRIDKMGSKINNPSTKTNEKMISG